MKKEILMFVFHAFCISIGLAMFLHEQNPFGLFVAGVSTMAVVFCMCNILKIYFERTGE